MSKKKGDPQVLPEGTIRVTTNGTKWIKENGKWVYMKKPREEWNMPIAKPKLPKPEPVFPPVNLPDHIKATKYPNYYISSDGISYREPRPIDASGRFGEINQWGLIQLSTSLRGNPYDESKMYEGINIYFYDKNGKNIGHKKKNIHQLVAESWVPNPNNYNEILHIDENNRNNHYTNLKWGTHKENMQCKHLPDGTIRNVKGNVSKYIKKDGEWVLIPSDKPPWNKGLKGSSWNTLPDETVRIRKVNAGYGKFIKQDGKWVYQGKVEG